MSLPFTLPGGHLLLWMTIAVILDLLIGVANAIRCSKFNFKEGCRKTASKFCQYTGVIAAGFILANVTDKSAGEPTRTLLNFAIEGVIIFIIYLEVRSIMMHLITLDKHSAVSRYLLMPAFRILTFSVKHNPLTKKMSFILVACSMLALSCHTVKKNRTSDHQATDSLATSRRSAQLESGASKSDSSGIRFGQSWEQTNARQQKRQIDTWVFRYDTSLKAIVPQSLTQTAAEETEHTHATRTQDLDQKAIATADNKTVINTDNRDSTAKQSTAVATTDATSKKTSGSSMLWMVFAAFIGIWAITKLKIV